MLILTSKIIILLLKLIHGFRLFDFLFMIDLLLVGELKNKFLLLDKSQLEFIEFLVLFLGAEMKSHALFFSFLEKIAKVMNEHVMKRLVPPIQRVLIFFHRLTILLRFLHMKFRQQSLKFSYFRIS